MRDRHERIIPSVLTIIAIVALGRGAIATAAETFAVAMLYVMTVRILSRRHGEWPRKFRFVVGYLTIMWQYFAIERIVPALRLPRWDGTLLAVDEVLLSQTPAVMLSSVMGPRLTDLMHLCYLSYIVYLHSVIFLTLAGSADGVDRLAEPLLTAFTLGGAGYLIVPAMGPATAFPGLFAGPLPESWVSHWCGWFVTSGSSRFDVFPSLHVLITAVLLDHDRVAAPLRFRLMVIPALGLVTSTVALRYHYGVDLLAGVGMFVIVKCLTRENCRRNSANE